MFHEVVSRIAGMFRRRRMAEEFDDEVRDHLQMLAERFAAQGMHPEDAAYAARRQFGDVTRVKEDLRERSGLPGMDVLVRDVRHAFRQLGKTKGFTAAAALTLALGIGASTAVFAVLDTVVLRPLPFAEPDRLMAFRLMDRRGTPHPALLSYPDFFDFRKQNRVFEHLVCYREEGFTLTDSQPAVEVVGEIVSWDLFPMLGVQPELGRGFLAAEEKPGTHAVVLSDGLWKSRFGSDTGILGTAIRMNGTLFTVVGIAPAGFQFPVDSPPVELWVTLSEDAAAGDQRGARMLDAAGRLRRGVAMQQAQTQMDLVASALAQQYPGNQKLDATLVIPELQRMTGTSRKPLLVLMGAVAMLLMIACVNVANLLLARNTGRTREFALRTALGASRWAIVRQLLIESLALATLGTAAGVLLAQLALKVILRMAGGIVPRLAEASIDGRVLTFSILVAVLTSVLFSVAPALQAAGAAPSGALKEDARSIARGSDKFRSGLVVVQIMLGLVLVVGAEILMTGFLHLVQRDPGFRTDHLLTFQVGMPESQYDVAHQIAFRERLMERLRAIPGVLATANGRPLPLQGHEMRAAFDIENRKVPAADRPRCDTAIVSPGYFGTMGIPLLRGRDFSERDDAEAPPVLVVNQAFARRFFPGEEVIGKRITPGLGRTPVAREIVGVAGDAAQEPLGANSDPIYYFPYKQLPWGIGNIVVRTAVPPQELESAARAELASLDRQAAMHHVETGTELSARVTAAMEFLTTLMGTFAAVAMLLTGAGLFGVLSYTVARRRSEIGVRIALGAGRYEVLGLVFRQALQLVAAGMMLGLIVATAGGRLVANLVSGIRPGDPVILAGGCCIVLITGVAAAYVPAARAASVDPMEALRSE